MNRDSRVRGARGFTLIELMISVAIVGLLSSVAIPEFQRAQVRSKAAERHLVMAGIARAVGDVVQAQQRFPAGLNGGWNPSPMTPGRRKLMDWTMPGWNQLPMIVEGATYYQYQFILNTGVSPPLLTVVGLGDLDADGDASTRVATYHIQGFSLVRLVGDGDSFQGSSAEDY